MLRVACNKETIIKRKIFHLISSISEQTYVKEKDQKNPKEDTPKMSSLALIIVGENMAET